MVYHGKVPWSNVGTIWHTCTYHGNHVREVYCCISRDFCLLYFCGIGLIIKLVVGHYGMVPMVLIPEYVRTPRTSVPYGTSFKSFLR